MAFSSISPSECKVASMEIVQGEPGYAFKQNNLTHIGERRQPFGEISTGTGEKNDQASSDTRANGVTSPEVTPTGSLPEIASTALSGS